MKKPITHFIQRLSASLMISVLLIGLITSCTRSAQEDRVSATLQLSPQIRARLDSMDSDLEIPEGITPEEQVVYIENQVLTTPISATELLALHPIHTLDPGERYQDYITDTGWEKFRLMNRFMRMQYVAMGDPMDELSWGVATSVILHDYATSLGITQSQAIDSLLSAADYLCCGTQYEINQCTYVMASVEYYKTLAAYKSFIEDMPEYLQPLLYAEYIAWNKMNKVRHRAYTSIVRAGEHYSALPMEFEGMYAAYAEKRKQVQDVERQILSAHKEYPIQHPVVRTADWEHYLQALRNKSADEDDVAIIQELDETVRSWISARQKIAKHLPAPEGTSYDNLTADYHWAIVNHEERVPSMYE